MKIKFIATIITVLFSISSISCYAIEKDESENNTFSFYSDVFEYDIITTNTSPPQTNVYVYLPSDIMASEFFEKIEITGGLLLLSPIDTSQFTISFFGKTDVFNEDMDNIGNIIPVVAEDVNLDGSVNKTDLILTLKKALLEPNSMDIDIRQYDFNNDGEINCFDLVFLKRELLS